MRRAQSLSTGRCLADWPEVYVFSLALGCRIDVYEAAPDALDAPAYLYRSCVPNKLQPLPRWCLVRDAERWTPLIGPVPDADAIALDAAMAIAADVADGPGALYAAIATLSVLSPLAHQKPLTSKALRALAVDALMHEANTPYAERDAALMAILALMGPEAQPG